jgi:hypothetical protein
MNENEFKIRKIYLSTFIDVLVDLYDRGVDYIDLLASLQDDQDVVGISFCKEYMNKEFKEDFDKIPEMMNVNKNLSEDDLNQLL